MAHILDVLKARGLLDGVTAEEELRAKLAQPTTLYAGFDPTAESLHLGNLVPIMVLAWFQKLGHRPIVLIGGATGMIGDPSGKSSERALLDAETIQRNCIGIRKNLQTILDFSHPQNAASMVNNYDWFSKITLIDFLRDIAKHARMGIMLAKDSVKTRLNSEEGMSFTEFSYQLLQGYDFVHLYKEQGVQVQVGGSDQWGNIVMGTELIGKMCNGKGYGVTFPLLTRSDGQKFGKSESGAIWLSADKLSPYAFYQYLVRVPDADVLRLLRMITFVDLEEINRYESAMKLPDYVPNTAQKRLAEEVTRMIHGEEGLQTALRATKAIAPGADTQLNAEKLEALSADVPTVFVALERVAGTKIVDFLVELSLLASKADVRRLIQNNGLYLNNQCIQDNNHTLTAEDLIEGRLMLLSLGKKNKHLVRVKQ